MPATQLNELPHRGSPDRITNFMEEYQSASFGAIAAAAGCVPSKPPIDEGVDYVVTHRSLVHPKGVAVVWVQLKSTTCILKADADHLTVQLSRQRYDQLREVDPTVDQILVLMSVPESRDNWIRQRDSLLFLRHSNYWLNLAGMPAATVKKPIVKVPRAQRFDDIALLDMMVRIGGGGAP